MLYILNTADESLKFDVRNPCGWHRRAETCRSGERPHFYVCFNLYFDLVLHMNTTRVMQSAAAVNELTSCSSLQCNHLQGSSSCARRHLVCSSGVARYFNARDDQSQCLPLTEIMNLSAILLSVACLALQYLYTLCYEGQDFL
jgi:hypothetical protein